MNKEQAEFCALADELLYKLERFIALLEQVNDENLSDSLHRLRELMEGQKGASS